MGGCTSKPKVLKGDEAEPLEPAPQKAVEEEEKKEKAVVKAAAVVDDEAKKDKDEATDDDNGSKSRSLGNLFKEVTVS